MGHDSTRMFASFYTEYLENVKMEPLPYITEAERVRKILIERYMHLNRHYFYESDKEQYPWLDDSAKV
ncbi:hypothetical protein CEXT_47021 [Caerostris extrusa]|uniref:Uncharacterized protein n=1 Tax=Caerostris extrusa TaxID=172846 RepID=A0AAV4N5Y6_CAEEX|nr:hypothetical protein CEXT_47021 [Caerostris extrusa]